MRHPFRSLLFLLVTSLSLLVLWGCASSGQNASSGPKPTVVYVVRHAEKVTDNPQEQNPNLSAVGEVRAVALRDYLQNMPVQALFATQYQRTQQTLTPLAAARSLEIQAYDAADVAGVAQKVKLAYPGQTVVIAGHSNTILEVVVALGGKRPVAEVKDHQYNYLIKVTLENDKTPQVEVLTYGAASE